MPPTYTREETSPLGRVHTIRIPDPVWAILDARAEDENLRDGVSEIVRNLTDEAARGTLASFGIFIGHNKITQEHVERYREALEAARR
jgi:hypothetical protein